ncbi:MULTISPECIES: RHS repeat-associated core domain-containing protein [Pseudomonas syringae group]|uniref:RHS repeat-associated core domain-containing protein n=1 Tax=Pseudomonas syringae group TaxID=136849 RepID=UPI0009B2E254|nr:MULTISPECIES: RHS repeat-associated core domain-containing protein [Pseudomonas syringae group]
MSSGNRVVLCTYRYDPTDRLADCSPAGQGGTRLFYQKSLLATQIQGHIQHTLLRTDEHLLARLSVENNQSNCALLATDQQQSVIAAEGAAFAYTPYGHRHPSKGPMNLPGYTGQRLDPVTGHYLLGNGYRAFNPVLMRFNSPDSLSPFGEGGVNAYAYCRGDPVNWVDLTGSTPNFLKVILREAGIMKPSRSLPTGNEPAIATATASRDPLGEVRHSVEVSVSKRTDSPSLDAPSSIPAFKIGDNEFSVAEATAQRDELRKVIKTVSSRNERVPFNISRNFRYFASMVGYAQRRGNRLDRPVGVATIIQ